MKTIRINPLRSVAVVNVVTFLVILIFVVLPVAYVNMKDTENDLIDVLSSRLSLVAQRSVGFIDVPDVASLTNPKAMFTEPHTKLVKSLGRIQREFRVNNAVVYRYDGPDGFVYVADGNDWFNLGSPVMLHRRFPETYAAAMEAWESGQLGDTRLFRSGNSQFYQVDMPLKLDGKVVGILMLNDDATAVASEIGRRNLFMLLSVIGIILVEMIVSWGLTTHRFRPLLALGNAATEIGSGNLGVELPKHRGRNEIALIIEAFEKMIAGLRAQKSSADRRIRELEQKFEESARELAVLRGRSDSPA